MPVPSSTKKKIATWLLLILTLGVFLSFYFQDKISIPYPWILLISLFASLTTMGSSTLMGYYLLNRLGDPEPIRNQLQIGTAVALTGIIMASLNMLLVHSVFEPASMNRWQSLFTQWVLPVTIIILTAGIVTIRFEVALARLRETNREPKTKNKPNLDSADAIVLQNESGRTRIKLTDIIYLSAQKTKTVVHTSGGDYEHSVLLKNFMDSLPAGQFIRIHKSYGVNLDYCSHLKYNAGGSYILFLKDEDETNLPVGRTYASIIKKVIKGT